MIFIVKGDPPLTPQQATRRGERKFNAEQAQWQREQRMLLDPDGYKAWAEAWVADNVENTANNLFNHQLHAYRQAVARLARYRLADGRPEQIEAQPTGEFDENGDPVTETVITAPAIDPLPATVEQPVVDPETGEQTGVETVPNPAIVADDAERAQAQAVIDATPDEVKEFDTE